MRPVKVSSLATSRPTRRGRNWVPVMSGIRPQRISSTEICASGCTMRMSAAEGELEAAAEGVAVHGGDDGGGELGPDVDGLLAHGW